MTGMLENMAAGNSFIEQNFPSSFLSHPVSASRGQQQPVGLGVSHQRPGRLAAPSQLQQGSDAHEAPAQV